MQRIYLFFVLYDPVKKSCWSSWTTFHSKRKSPIIKTDSLNYEFLFFVDTDIVFVAGGKWTTYREMAQDAVDKVKLFDQILTFHFT